MELNASVIIEACRAGAEEAARLAPFLDDLDGWDGADCDTGSNGAATMAALEAAMDSLDPRAHLRDALEAAVETIIRRGLGHSGIALSSRRGPARWGTSLMSRRSRCAACLRHP